MLTHVGTKKINTNEGTLREVRKGKNGEFISLAVYSF